MVKVGGIPFMYAVIERRLWHVPPLRNTERCDLVNHQMVPVSGSQCGRCLDHDSTNLSTSAVFPTTWQGRRNGIQVETWTIAFQKLQEFCFFYLIFLIAQSTIHCCADLRCKEL